MAHRVRHLYIENDVKPFTARCRCGWSAVHSMKRQQVEDQIIAHHDNVERLRAALRGQPSLSSTRDYYLMMSTNPEQDPDQQALWRRLADEITHRLNDTDTGSEQQAGLF